MSIGNELNILVTGGCGYVGSVLVPDLLNQGHKITVVDTQWFGNQLKEDKNLKLTKSYFADLKEIDLKDIEVVIHLANIANDPSVDLDPVLSWEVNALHTNQLLDVCKNVGIKKFLYASSGSVYGVKSEDRVTEDLALLPISAYNKTKMVTERVCLSFEENFIVQCIRPATVCGLSPRMRFDVVVNMFVLQAFTNKKITVMGGDQIRPNIHIKDMSRVYSHFLNNDLPSGAYNAGFENLSVLEIANTVSQMLECEVEVTESNDPRSYKQDSTKLLNTGFIQEYSVKDAIIEIYEELKNGNLKDTPQAHTVKWMQTIDLSRRS